MRNPTACPECRVSKRKCVQDPASLLAACLACQSRAVHCSKPWSRIKAHLAVLSKKSIASATAASANSQPERLESQSVSSEDIGDFIHLYFRYIHDRPHSLFHEHSIRQQHHDGILPESLLAALCALGCRLSPHEHHRDLATSFRLKSKSLVAQNLGEISVSNVQTCMLLANSYAAEQNHGVEALYFGIANRMAYVLRLHKHDPDDSPILRETKCRIWWSLFMADRWCPPGLGLPREILSSDPSVDFPMCEVDFQRMRPGDEGPSQTRAHGFWYYKITLVDIFASIQDIDISLVHKDQDQPTIDEQVDDVAVRLHIWYESLPVHMFMNQQNLDAYREQGCAGTFVALHLGYHHYSTLLYFQYLEPDCEATLDARVKAAKCRQHGLEFSRLLHTARNLGDCHVVYLTVAQMTIVPSSVLLHLLLFGGDEEVETARVQLTRNFEALMDLSKYWPCVDEMKERLFVFQNACLRQSAAKTYTVDRWIVRFLLEYALPFEGKDGESEMNITASEPMVDTPSPNVPLERRMMLDVALQDLHNY